MSGVQFPPWPYQVTQPPPAGWLFCWLISRGWDAQPRPRRLEAKPLEKATEWLEGYREVWEGNFQHLDALLEEMKTQQRKRGPTKR